MATILAVAASDNWNSNGSWVGGVQPTAADDVTIVAGANVTIPTGVTALARSVTVASTGTVTFATTTSILTIGDATAGAGSVAFSNAGTITLTGIGTINFISTSATVQTITSGGQTMPNMTFNAASNGSWQFSDNQTATGATITLTKGTLDTNSKTVSATSISFATGTKTLTMGSSVLTLSGTTPISGAALTGLTMTANTGTFTTTAASQTITLNSPSFDFNGATLNLTPSAAGTILLNSNDATRTYTFANLTYTGPAAKTPILNFAVNYTITGTLTINGNTILNRVLVGTGTLGTTKTLTISSAPVVTNADFQDITGAGAGSWDISAATGGSGDCQGNTGITLTTPATQYYRPGGVNVLWSNVGNWSSTSGGTAGTGRVPLPQDPARFDASAGITTTVVQWDMPRLCADLDCTSASFTSGTFQQTLASGNIYGSFILKSGMGALTGGGSTTLLCGRGNHTITSGGATIGNTTGWAMTLNGPGGTYTLQDNTTWAGTLTVTFGTFVDNGLTLTMNGFISTSGFTRAVTKTGNWSLAGTSGTPWSVSAGGLTFSDTGNITISTVATGVTRTFGGGGLTYGTLNYTVAGSTGQLTITGSNTFARINFSDVTNARTLQFTSGQTNTIYVPNIFGTSTKNMTVSAVTAASATTIKSPSAGYIGANSTLTSGNTGLSLTADAYRDYISAQDITWVSTPSVFVESKSAGGMQAVQRAASW